MTGNFIASQVEALQSVGSVGVLNWGPFNTWYVDSAATGAANGKSWVNAVTTMTAALALCSSGDTILFTGTLTEDVSTMNDYTTGPADISIIGVGRNFRRPLWLGANTAPNIKLNCEGFIFENIRFNVAAGYEGIYLRMESGSGGAYMTEIRNCWFQGTTATKGAIQLYGAPHSLRIIGNRFNDITGTGGTGIECDSTSTHPPGASTFAYNTFTNCLNHIDLHAEGGSEFLHNMFHPRQGGLSAVVKYLNFRNPSGTMVNIMFGNLFGGTYSIAGGYQFNTLDSFTGNFADHVGAPTGGVGISGEIQALPT